MACSDVGGRITDGADSPAAAGSSDRAKALALQLLPGWRRLRLQTWVALASGHLLRMVKRCKWVGDERRRKAENGGVGTSHSRGVSGMVIGFRCGRGGLVLLALARSAARRLGDSAAWRLVGSPIQWEKPRNRSHAAACDRTTKPSWGSDTQAGLMRTPAFLPVGVSVNTPRFFRQKCAKSISFGTRH